MPVITLLALPDPWYRIAHVMSHLSMLVKEFLQTLFPNICCSALLSGPLTSVFLTCNDQPDVMFWLDK